MVTKTKPKASKYELTISLPIPQKKENLKMWLGFADFLQDSVAHMFNGKSGDSGMGFGYIDRGIMFKDKRDAELAAKQARKALTDQKIKGFKTHIQEWDWE